MDRIVIKDLVAHGILGVHDWERHKPRKIIINLTLHTDLNKSGMSDEIEDTVDYSVVARKVRDLIENTKCQTIEALATKIAQLCLDMPKVLGVQVRVEKPGAIRFSRTVGVEIERNRVE